MGSLPVADRSMPEALEGLAVPVATTNYASLIEKAMMPVRALHDS